MLYLILIDYLPRRLEKYPFLKVIILFYLFFSLSKYDLYPPNGVLLSSIVRLLRTLL